MPAPAPHAPAALAFARHVLGDPSAAAALPVPVDEERAAALAATWVALRTARTDVLTWGVEEDPAPPRPEHAALLAALAGLPREERAAAVLQALGCAPADSARVLDREPVGVEALLARAHAGLAGLPPAAATPACEQARAAVATEPWTRKAPAAAHRAACGEDCPAFTDAVREQRPALRAAVAPPGRPERSGPRDPASRVLRAGVAALVLAGSGAAGYAAVSAIEKPGAGGGDPRVVTATPVGPLPPGVGPGSTAAP